ncbi:Por secretion system C-terminal sorting domain-containing protein [Soonwooa buanensis]|uniref:Por secretion system C-terminal sorting domain-containing protein n=1 Tax=Soonwooa buanensis TaxID=619805 RepID=A0A1T5EIT7_9FLAO|nr:T9SS type A sorting domain-containing protein [Soonwooa buanensis]SKB83799.1 Por secretion system C-terminal sorting domain-containing protein [Soonwooa buanensis]
MRTGLRHQNVLDLSQVTIGERLTIADANSFEEIILPTDSKLINLTINQTLVENLDLSQQKKLESLSFYSNFNLKNIDFGPAGQHIGKLKHIDISKSPIESIIFNPNPDLNFLGLVSLQLKNLDISALTNLKHLIVEDIKLPSIDLSKNTELEEIEVNLTNIENFDFRTNTKLSTVNIHAPFQVTSDNVIQSLALWQASADALDFSNLNVLESLYLNQLNGEHLNLSNLPNGAQFIDIIDSDIKTINLKALDYNKIPYVNLVKNYFLTCILVDDVDLANNMNYWYKEDWNVYTTDCANIPPSEDVVNFIDKPLKKSFLQNDEINLNKDNEIQISEAEAYDYGLYFSAQDIMTETSWLPAFKNVRGISFGEVNIKDINLSGNLEISYFSLFRNDKIEQIDLSKNTKLFEIAIETNPNLEYVNLGNFASKGETTYLWMSANPKLKCIQVDNVEDAKQKVEQEDWYFESIDNPEDLFSTTCFATLATNAVNKEKIMLYPNPVSSVLNISKAATVLIYNTVGQLVKSEKNTSSVDVSNLNSGVYYIMLLDNNGKVIQKSKIIKN